MATQPPSSPGPIPPEPSTPAKAPAADQQAVQPADQQAMADQARQDSGAEEDEEEEYEEEHAGGRRFLLMNAAPSWLVSMVVHVIILLLLALLTFGVDERVTNVLTVAETDVDEIEQFQEELLDPIDVEAVTDPVADFQVDVPEEMIDPSEIADIDAAPAAVELSEFGEETAPKDDLLAEIGSVTGTGLEGRSPAQRAELAKRAGATDASEAAVAMALAWLAEHQLPDGGWSFDHRGGRCQGRCPNHGGMDQARNAATAMALLPFLGAGQTHREGKYRTNVYAGLSFLSQRMKREVRDGIPVGDLSEPGGRLYSHGLCAITLCEAYAMTHDRNLITPAQLSINYIVYAQDPVGGGWRYQPKQAGDTSVVGWKLMALKSGHMAYLQVPERTVRGSIRFLDSVQASGGARYGYTGPGDRDATSAIGLLCRMYLGWKREHPPLERGVEILSKRGPSQTDMYYNYYATQVMRHYEGEVWTRWNNVMRDQLVDSQNKSGHTRGSWFISGDRHSAGHGGRLYSTSMATMILEVYYRHMPIYAAQAAEEEFPL